MAWTLEEAKKQLGITGSDQDALIQQVLDETLSTVELYLNRRLMHAREVLQLTDVYLPYLYVPRYPIETVHAIDGEAVADMRIDAAQGWIDLGGRTGDLEVDYEGGYETLPPELERMLWQIFHSAWRATDPETSAPQAALGAVSSVTLQDFGTVRFGVPTGSAEAGEGVNAWGSLAPWATLLAKYRTVRAI